VSPTPGTTRDAIAVSLAFDGWPVDVIDTAGMRNAPDALEREGVQRAEDAVRQCDLCLWIVDATSLLPNSEDDVVTALDRSADSTLIVLNKCDLIAVPSSVLPDASRISAVTGMGIAELGERIAATLVPNPPRPGDPVPFTKEQCERWST
jgi:tRNA modification GTPase